MDGWTDGTRADGRMEGRVDGWIGSYLIFSFRSYRLICRSAKRLLGCLSVAMMCTDVAYKDRVMQAACCKDIVTQTDSDVLLFEDEMKHCDF